MTEPYTLAVGIECPACGTVVDVPITARIVVDGDRQVLDLAPDTTDLWAHMWTHENEGGDRD